MGRLMKYDLRAALRLFVPLWIGTMLLTIINRFTMVTKESLDQPILRFLTGLVMAAYVLAIIAIVVIAVIYIVVRFYQGLLKDEGYLTFTLPVSIDSILWSKALTGMILLAGSAIVAAASFFILLMEQGDLQIIGGVFLEAFEVMGFGHAAMVIFTALLLAVAACLSSIYQAYLSMGIGQMSQKHKLAVSILTYVGIGFAISTVTGLGTMPLLINVLEHIGQGNFLRLFEGPQGAWLLLLGLALYNLVFAAIFYFPARFLFKNRLNLE